MSHQPCRILGLPGGHRNWGWRKGKEKMLVVMGMHSQWEKVQNHVTGYGLNRELQKLNHKWLFLYYMEICPRTLIVNVLFISSMQFLYLENRIKCRLARRRIWKICEIALLKLRFFKKWEKIPKNPSDFEKMEKIWRNLWSLENKGFQAKRIGRNEGCPI